MSSLSSCNDVTFHQHVVKFRHAALAILKFRAPLPTTELIICLCNGHLSVLKLGKWLIGWMKRTIHKEVLKAKAKSTNSFSGEDNISRQECVAVENPLGALKPTHRRAETRWSRQFFQKESTALLMRSSPNNTTQSPPCARSFCIPLALQITRPTDYWQQKGTQYILKWGSATTFPWIQSAFNLIANAVTSCHRLNQRPEPAPYFRYAY